MALTDNGDVLNSGIRPGLPMQFAGITCSVLPNATALGKRPENFWVPQVISASGQAARLDGRLDHEKFYTS